MASALCNCWANQMEKLSVSIKFSHHRGNSSYDWNNLTKHVILLKFIVIFSQISERYITVRRKKRLY